MSTARHAAPPSRRLPVAALAVAALLWGVATSGTKYALGAFAPITLLAVELTGAAMALWAVHLIRGYRRPPSWALVATLGLLEPWLAYLVGTLGLARTSAANGALLEGLESLFVVVLAAVFLAERITRPLCAAIGTGLLGLIVLEHAAALSGRGVGDALVLGGALSAAVYTIFARRLGAGYGVSFLLYKYAITVTRAGPASVIVNLIPVFGFLSALLWLRNPPRRASWRRPP
jgi:drug/metabolite transporter (DMT)-like permease